MFFFTYLMECGFIFIFASREFPDLRMLHLCNSILIGVVTLTSDLLTSKRVTRVCVSVLPILGILALSVVEVG